MIKLKGNGNIFIIIFIAKRGKLEFLSTLQKLEIFDKF